NFKTYQPEISAEPIFFVKVYREVRVFRYLCSLHDKTDFIFLLTIRIIRYTFLMISLSKK
ncbi:hypothetical protein, partial [Phocaeicola vulgatus]|uniref:hypothetical protein n=1 Tax=Phocaeicola vulgatus TaxID=821 RepID=UPI000EC3A4E3